MKRIGVISDSHGDRGQMEFALMKMEAEGRLDWNVASSGG